MIDPPSLSYTHLSIVSKYQGKHFSSFECIIIVKYERVVILIYFEEEVS